MTMETPPQEIFDQIKDAAIEIWSTYDDTYGYRTGKLDRIKDIKNIKDNWYSIVSMFDYNNQNRLLDILSGYAYVLVERSTRENRDLGKRLFENREELS